MTDVRGDEDPGAPPAILKRMFEAAVAAASPSLCVPRWLPQPPSGRTVVVGGGKAAAAMAAAVESCWRGELSGLVVTRYGHGVPCKRIEVLEAGHPVPDEGGWRGAERILRMVQGLTEDDLVICLLSGGASALLAAPAVDIAFADKQAINRELLKSGATIREINCVRKHLSRIKGGRLALAAFPAPVVSLIISDVPNDDISAIGSGPTAGDPTTSNEAIDILQKYEVDVAPPVLDYLNSAASETPKPELPGFQRVRNLLVTTPRAALQAAADVAIDAGYRPIILGDWIEGEARDVALVHAAIARHCARYGEPGQAPCILVSGGETTVTVRGEGRGGRNTEFLMSLAVALEGHPAITAIACDTDGFDGTESNAGAIVKPDTLARLQRAEINPREILSRHDSYSAFSAIGDLITTGPTLTNVNDFRAVLIEKAC
jgi:glycerate 2-kinase